MKLTTCLFALACLLPVSALAAVGPLDDEGYRAMDSLAPDPALPSTMLDLMVGTTASGSFTDLEDDKSWYFDIGTYGSSTMYGYTDSSLYVHSNGIITSSSTSAYFNNMALPDGRFSSRQLIAPYWDDLTPVAGLSTLTWQAEAGSHVIVEWTDWALYADPTVRLSFRVTFGLDQGWVLFQYTKMEGADGGSATIGIQDRYQDPVNSYSYNTAGAVVAGTAGTGVALQAILFDLDADGDQLPRRLENVLGSDDTEWDSDGGGVSDIGEYVAGTVLSDASDDDTTDTDGDGLTDVDEAFYGTNAALVDTDGDTLSDYDEVVTQGTDPTLADTDGDGWNDDVELTEGTDPTDPGDFPVISFGVSSDTKHKVRATLCDDGNIHVVATNDSSDSGLYYYALSTTGTVLIAETLFDLVDDDVKYPGIACFGSTVFLTYEHILPATTGDDDDATTAPDTAVLGVIAIDPSLDDQDGSVADPTAITTASVVLDIEGNPRHHRVVAAANGLHFVYELQVDPWPDGNGDEESVGYTQVDLALVEQAELVLANFPRKKGDGSSIFGTHKGHSPALAVDAAGVAHVVFSAQTAPYYQYVDETNYPSGLWYAAVSGTTVEGPHYLSHGMLERLDVSLDGSLLRFSISAGYDTNHDFYKSQGVRYGVLDTAAYLTIPRVGSQYDFDISAVDPSSFVVPIAPVYLNNQSMQGATITAMPDGVTIHSYAKDWDDVLCMIPVGADGSTLGDERCFFDEEASKYTRYKGIMDLGGALGVVFNDWNSDMNFGVIDADMLYDATSVPAYPTRNPPAFVSTAATYAVVGEQYTYTPVATDPEGDIEGFTLLSGPTAAVFDGTTLTWTPVAADAGTADVEIQVADVFGLTANQAWTITIYDPNATGDDDDSAGDDDDDDDDTTLADDDDTTGDDDDSTTGGCDNCSSSVASGNNSSLFALLFVLGAALRRRRL